MNSLAMLGQMVVTASVKAPATITDGVRGKPVTSIIELMCTRLDPINKGEIEERFQIEAPRSSLQAFTWTIETINVGDTLVVDTDEYPIRALGKWADGDGTLYELVLEDMQ